jgi:hypothetical protein
MTKEGSAISGREIKAGEAGRGAMRRVISRRLRLAQSGSEEENPRAVLLK